MRTKRFFLFGLLAVLLATSLVLTGCGGDDGDGDGLNLPGITEPTTGLQTVEGKDITVSGTGMPQSLETQTGNNGETFTISGGKFSFTLPESPPYPQALSSGYSLRYTLFGDVSGDYTATPGDATFVMVSSFQWNAGNTYYEINRAVTDTDMATYQDRSQIVYVYASKDVTLSQDADTWEDSWSEGNVTETYKTQWGAVNLALKKGWNLVQIDSYETKNGNDYTQKATVKIATHNVPWTIDTWEESYG
ncbi:MAG: hypothetical protein LBL44_09975 [Treponema sp.]|jgi:hypothetical protein|nr:hypothetical protein [Treponema sp.]